MPRRVDGNFRECRRFGIVSIGGYIKESLGNEKNYQVAEKNPVEMSFMKWWLFIFQSEFEKPMEFINIVA